MVQDKQEAYKSAAKIAGSPNARLNGAQWEEILPVVHNWMVGRYSENCIMWCDGKSMLAMRQHFFFLPFQNFLYYGVVFHLLYTERTWNGNLFLKYLHLTISVIWIFVYFLQFFFFFAQLFWFALEIEEYRKSFMKNTFFLKLLYSYVSSCTSLLIFFVLKMLLSLLGVS